MCSRGADADDVEEQDAAVPLLPQPATTGGGNRPRTAVLAAAAAAAARRETASRTAAPFADAPGECEQQQLSTLLQTNGTRVGASYSADASSSADAAGAYSSREGVAPVMVAAARVSARMVSAPGPVVTQHGLPQATTMMTGSVGSGGGGSSSSNSRNNVPTSGFNSSSDGPRRDDLPNFQEAAARAQGSNGRNSKNEDDEDQREGDLQERGGVIERGRSLVEGEQGDDHHPLAVQGSSGFRLGLGGGTAEDTAATGSVMEPTYSDGESSSPGSSESGEGSAPESESVSCLGCSQTLPRIFLARVAYLFGGVFACKARPVFSGNKIFQHYHRT